MTSCLICASLVEPPHVMDNVEIVQCPRCGLYRVSLFDKKAIANRMAPLRESKRKIANASGWISEHQNELITSKSISQFETLPTPSYGERKRKLLEFLQKQSSHLGQRLELDNVRMPRLTSASWCRDDEISFLISGVDDLIESDNQSLRLTAKGYDFLSQLNVNPDSQIGFCAMWFVKVWIACLTKRSNQL